MKIKKVIFQNIGVYVDYNEFDLDTDQPIILIGGMNGRGKTTFLDSILFVLYGRRAIVTPSKLEEYLRKISNTSGKSTICFIEMQFTAQEQEGISSYRIRRSWNLEKPGLKMNTQVWRENMEDTTLSENWDLFVEEILPRAIASFFFFDGEKISELAATESDTHIQSSILSLLGIDIVDQLLSDLKTVAASTQKEMSRGHYRDELSQLQQKLSEIAEKISDKEKMLKEERVRQKQIEQRLTELEDVYTMTGGEYARYQKELEREQNILLRRAEDNQAQMLELAASNLPLKLVEPLLVDIEQAAEKEKKQKELDVFIRQFPVLYQDYVGNDAWNDQIKVFFETIKEKQEETELVYQLDKDARLQLKDIKYHLKDEVIQGEKLIQENRELKGKQEKIENYLAVRVKDENLAGIYDEIKAAVKEQAACLLHIEDLENGQKENQQQQESLEKEKKQILEMVVQEMETTDENLRILSYVKKQTAILTEYKKRLLEMKTKELSKQMTICFQKLISKEGLINRIDIDPSTLEFRYFGREDRELDRQKLSSGEKQLLVIAMLWALGICSKSKFPLIIDTPLARLDSVHRASLIENYFPKASEQVIILSTDQEITKQDYEILKKYVGKEYTLVYNEKTMSSSICEGYFGGNRG